MHKINKGHFASFLGRPLNEESVKRVCKSCTREHFDRRMLDLNRNLQMSGLRKYIASSLTALSTFLRIWNSSEAFEYNCLCGMGALASRFCQWTPNLCYLHLGLLLLYVAFYCCRRKFSELKLLFVFEL